MQRILPVTVWLLGAGTSSPRRSEGTSGQWTSAMEWTQDSNATVKVSTTENRWSHWNYQGGLFTFSCCNVYTIIMEFYPWSVRPPLPSFSSPPYISFCFNLLSYFHLPNRPRSLHKLWRRCQSGLWCCVSLKTCAVVLSSLWPGGWALALAWSLPSSSGTFRFVSTCRSVWVYCTV